MANTNFTRDEFMARFCKTISAAALALIFTGAAHAQAGPGPISGAPDTSGPAARAATSGPRRDTGQGKMAGDWQINQALSDDPRQKMEKATGSPRGRIDAGPGTGTGTGGGTHGPWGGPGGGSGRRNSGNGSAREDKLANDIMGDLASLTIVQTPKIIKVVSDSGRLLAIYPGSDQSSGQTSTQGSSPSSTQGSSQPASQGGTQGNSKPAESDASKASSTQMQGEALVVITQRNGMKMTRTFSPSSDGTQLYLTTRLEGGHFKDPVTIRFVYDPGLPAADDDSQ